MPPPPATRQYEIVVEHHADGYVSCAVRMNGGVRVGQGDTVDEALADVRSAIQFHIETFGQTDEDEDKPRGLS